MMIYTHRTLCRISTMLYDVDKRLMKSLQCKGIPCVAGALCENCTIRATLSNAIDAFEGRKNRGVVE